MNNQRTSYDSDDLDTSTYENRTLSHLIHSARRNLNELIKLINRLFEYHSRLLVVRIDLRYSNEVAAMVPLEIAQQHREQLFSDRQDNPAVFGHLLSYAWCLEKSDQDSSGYHFHVLAIYNGAHRRDDVGIGLAIRDLWKSITNGYGQCYISNFDRDKLEKQGNLGIGMIHRNDSSLRINLIEKVATYITKKCNDFDIESGRTESGQFRTFGRSWMPKPLDPNVPRRGRPPVKAGIW